MLREFILCAILLVPFSSAAVLINEVHPDPIDDESLNEWVELYNDGPEPVNVSGWVFGDASDNDTIKGGRFNGEGAQIPAFGFAILTDDTTRVYENYNVSSDAVHLYIDDSALGNGLLNDGEQIFLFFNGTLMAQANYTKPGQGFSSSLVNGSFKKSSPTPGTHNNGSVTSSCDYEVQIVLNGSMFANPDDFSWKLIVRNLRGSSTNITSRAAIRDLFGNVEREYSPFTNQSITTQRTSSSFSPNLGGGKSYVLTANLTTQCEDSSQDNNKDERIFTIQGTLTANSYLTLLSVLDLGSDGSASFGQTIRMHLNAYRGDTSKESIAAWIESSNGKKISKQSRASVDEKFSNITLTLPIQIIPNCDGEFDDDSYILRVEGLDAEDERGIDVEGTANDACGEIKTAKASSSPRGKLSFQITNLPSYAHNEQSTATLRITNTGSEEKKADMWSYVYRGSASYSGDREANRELITLPPNSASDIYLSPTPLLSRRPETTGSSSSLSSRSSRRRKSSRLIFLCPKAEKWSRQQE